MNQPEFNRMILRYVNGFAASLVLSVVSYLLITERWVGSAKMAMMLLLLLATAQLIVQLVSFLHLSWEGRSRNRTLSFIFTILMMLIIVIGSIWIMNNLDYRMKMSGEAMDEYMKAQNEKGF